MSLPTTPSLWTWSVEPNYEAELKQHFATQARPVVILPHISDPPPYLVRKIWRPAKKGRLPKAPFANALNDLTNRRCLQADRSSANRTTAVGNYSPRKSIPHPRECLRQSPAPSLFRPRLNSAGDFLRLDHGLHVLHRFATSLQSGAMSGERFSFRRPNGFEPATRYAMLVTCPSSVCARVYPLFNRSQNITEFLEFVRLQ